MPGIVGIITRKPAKWAESKVRQMVEAQRHESFYTSGAWRDECLGVYVGWTALQNSFSDGMPLTNERGDVSLVFSGEEYPEPGTAERLRRQGHSLNSDDSSYLVHLYEDDRKLPCEVERNVPWSAGGSDTRHGNVVQRPLRNASDLLPRRRRTHSISPRKPRRYCECVPNFAALTARAG